MQSIPGHTFSGPGIEASLVQDLADNFVWLNCY